MMVVVGTAAVKKKTMADGKNLSERASFITLSVSLENSSLVSCMKEGLMIY